MKYINKCIYKINKTAHGLFGGLQKSPARGGGREHVHQQV